MKPRVAKKFNLKPKKTDDVVFLNISAISTDKNTQARMDFDEETLARYKTALQEGVEFPPIIVFKSQEGELVLSDGFHRLAAHHDVGKKEIGAFIKKGSFEDALLYSIEANKSHGLPLCFDDRKNVALQILESNSGKSNRSIAQAVGISRTLVGQLRKELTGNNCQIDTRQVERNGKTYSMNVVKIGGQSLQENDLENSLLTDLSTNLEDEKDIDDALRQLESEVPESNEDKGFLEDASDDDSFKSICRCATNLAQKMCDRLDEVEQGLLAAPEIGVGYDFSAVEALSKKTNEFLSLLKQQKSDCEVDL